MAYSCSAGNVCAGTSAQTTQLFQEFQNIINRVGASAGIKAVKVDGKIGPETAQRLYELVTALSARLGTELSKALEYVLIELNDTKTAPPEIAANAYAIASALKTDGAKVLPQGQAPGPIVFQPQTPQSAATNILATGNPPSPHVPTPSDMLTLPQQQVPGALVYSASTGISPRAKSSPWLLVGCTVIAAGLIVAAMRKR